MLPEPRLATNGMAVLDPKATSHGRLPDGDLPGGEDEDGRVGRDHAKCPVAISQPLTSTTQARLSGRNTFQPSRISWS